MISYKTFAHLLLTWSQDNQRDLPWKSDRNPYKIWLSEVILQQTRVNQGMPYYLHFIEEYPDIFALANATEDQILKSWEGLGYYTRARNLHKAAQIIASELNGVFPVTYADLLQLPGIGPYSAAAIASFAYELSVAVVDGNVLRVISRITGLKIPVDSKEGKAYIQNFADNAIQFALPSAFNQAIMDIGATICKPAAPLCKMCPFSDTCCAYLSHETDKIPIKKNKISKKERLFVFLDIIINKKYTLLVQQKNNDIWKGMFLFPFLQDVDNNYEKSVQKLTDELFGKKPDLIIHKTCNKPLKQILTHRIVYAEYIQVIIDNIPEKINKTFHLVERAEMQNFAMPKIMKDYLKNLNI
ncbi:MAG TPA: A/G-specific adenine glycosylase [Saprospiraceae bacterium]|nr:A/G-specific adenine glycosylase [Saprospiraceae bacterium]HRO72250.1 A/G-specific adenine glycosylase [Saprospiraceae bacterium]HRP42244.1 A/G-specific adenine glycosylase [Saprospiraceae bacterium]